MNNFLENQVDFGVINLFFNASKSTYSRTSLYKYGLTAVCELPALFKYASYAL